jgi:4-hydroxy-3-methylbut-2-enyl diphosphate reductase
MYKRETKEIGREFEVSMLKKFGPEKLAEHYAEFDTICDATQVETSTA